MKLSMVDLLAFTSVDRKARKLELRAQILQQLEIPKTWPPLSTPGRKSLLQAYLRINGNLNFTLKNKGGFFGGIQNLGSGL